MRRVGAPFDEEGKQAVCVVFEIERFPAEHVAVGAFAGAGSRTFGNDAGVGEVGSEDFNVAGMGGPSDQATVLRVSASILASGFSVCCCGSGAMISR